MNFSNGKNINLAWFGLLLISWIMLNNSFFMHYHQLDDGRYVIHAHPFNKTAEEGQKSSGHTHSCKELVFINFVNSLLVLLILFAGFILLQPIISGKLISIKFISYLEIYLKIVKPRPPPTFIIK
jgi:hypothetical protein